MAMTVTDMVTAVLEELGVLGAGSTPSAADAITIKSAYQQWHSLASGRQIIDWYGADVDIPSGAEHGVVLCVCNHVYRKFGVARDASWVAEGEASLANYMHNYVPAPQTEIVNF